MNFSKSQVNKAGRTLRLFIVGRRELSRPEQARAIDALDYWRSLHAVPLNKATMGLRSRVLTAKCRDPRVSQRLKRRPTIIGKLARHPTMQLSTMQDIAGCRAVLDSPADVRRVEKRWTRHPGKVLRVDDYMATPKPDGYRAVHLVVTYDGYPVEVQLRTRFQHAWATGIEGVGQHMGQDLKSGEGSPEVLRFFWALGGLLADADGLADTKDESFREVMATAGHVPKKVLELVGLKIQDDGLVITV